MSNTNPRKRKAPAKPPGGLNLLDSIMGGMSKTMDRLPTRKPGAAAASTGDELEVATHFQMVRPPTNGGPVDKTRCRNIECNSREFDVDMRQGDRICRNCGCVQNSRSVESYEEEKRTFADDDNKESKQRTSQVHGKGGGSVGNSGLARVHALAAAEGSDTDAFSERDQIKIDQYKTKARTIGETLELSQQIILEGQKLCEKLVASENLHAKECGKAGTGASCRLTFRHRSPAVVAAAVLKEAMRLHQTDRLFEELKAALKGDDVDAADAKKVGRMSVLVSELLKGRPFHCEEESDETRALDAARTEDALAQEAKSDGGGLHPAAALMPRLCSGLLQPFWMNQRATQIVEDWARRGMPTLLPQTTASLALLRAYAELCVPMIRDQRGEFQRIPPLTVELLANESGISPATLQTHTKHPDLPWPTTILADATQRLVANSSRPKPRTDGHAAMPAPPTPGELAALDATTATAAQQILESWLGPPVGPKREFCRRHSPKLLAACALLKATQTEPPAPSAVGVPGVLGTGAALSAVPPLSAAQVAAALGVDVGALLEAMANMPPGA